MFNQNQLFGQNQINVMFNADQVAAIISGILSIRGQRVSPMDISRLIQDTFRTQNLFQPNFQQQPFFNQMNTGPGYGFSPNQPSVDPQHTQTHPLDEMLDKVYGMKIKVPTVRDPINNYIFYAWMFRNIHAVESIVFGSGSTAQEIHKDHINQDTWKSFIYRKGTRVLMTYAEKQTTRYELYNSNEMLTATVIVDPAKIVPGDTYPDVTYPVDKIPSQVLQEKLEVILNTKANLILSIEFFDKEKNRLRSGSKNDSLMALKQIMANGKITIEIEEERDCTTFNIHYRYADLIDSFGPHVAARVKVEI